MRRPPHVWDEVHPAGAGATRLPPGVVRVDFSGRPPRRLTRLQVVARVRRSMVDGRCPECGATAERHVDCYGNLEPCYGGFDPDGDWGPAPGG